MPTRPSLRPYLTTGVLLGLAVASFPWARLEFLAWFGFVPMLRALGSETSFKRFVGCSFTAMLTWVAVGTSWFLATSVTGALFSFALGGAAFTVPFAVFHFVSRHLGRRPALWALPFVWTAWEWVYHHSALSLGQSLASTQANAVWLIQFIDLTGAWGAMFWVMCLNVLLTLVWENHARRDRNPGFPTRKLVPVACVMFVPPLLYSGWCFWKYTHLPPAADRHVSLLLVQPNINPWIEADESRRVSSVEKTVFLTDQALTRNKPDVIVWPEAAIPFAYRQTPDVEAFIGQAVTDWNTPLVTGVLDVKRYAGDEKRPRRLEVTGRDFELFNGAFVIEPDRKAPQNPSHVKVSPISTKQRLVPFVERTPWVERFPFLLRWTINLGGNPLLDEGPSMPLTLQTADGETVTLGTQICYEALYPQGTAEMVRGGAQFLVILSNDGWFSRTQGAYTVAAWTQLRAIETRRSVVRCANTGPTFFCDALGRHYGGVPWWDEQTALADIRLSNEATVYSRFTNVFPFACGLVSIVFLVAAAGKSMLGFISRFREERL